MASQNTQVGIIGAGPAGLLLAHLLHRQGIDSVILESHTRQYIEERVRAGVLEQPTVDLLIESGVGERLQRQAMQHGGVHFAFANQQRRVDFRKAVGRDIFVYAQHEVVIDLVAARLAYDGPLIFEAEAMQFSGIEDSPVIRYRTGGEAGTDHELHCDYIAACDGFHGVGRPAMPSDGLKTYERVYPFGWLGILARVAPASEELIYANHESGFALLSMRSPEVSRLYIQVEPDDDIANWSDARIWDQLHQRLETPGFALQEGPIFQKSIAQLRSFVSEPMQHGRLFLAGDAAHIVPPTGAKGLNLAAHDVWVLAQGLVDQLRHNKGGLLERYSALALRRVWRAQRFSWWMTQMLHRYNADPPFDYKRQLAELDYLTSSDAAAASFAEQYTGLPFRLD